MKIGINTCLWQWPFDSQRVDLFKKVSDFGYDGIEMTIEDRSEKNLVSIKNNIKKTNLVPIVCSSFVNGNLVDKDSETIKKGVKYVKDSIDLCEYLGAKILVGPTYGSCVKKDFLYEEVKNRAKQQAIVLLKDIGKYALDKKINIAIEPINRYESNFLNTAQEGIDLLKEINLPNVGLNLDTYHMNIEEKNSKKAVLDSGKHLFHMHAPENDRGTPGTGDVDWSGIAESLKKIDFDGFIVMESGSPKVDEVAKLGAFWRVYDYPQDEMAKRGLKFLRNLLT
jgi:D-psicose/D-tagatose/L-ribulose 3-epimerase